MNIIFLKFNRGLNFVMQIHCKLIPWFSSEDRTHYSSNNLNWLQILALWQASGIFSLSEKKLSEKESRKERDRTRKRAIKRKGKRDKEKERKRGRFIFNPNFLLLEPQERKRIFFIRMSRVRRPKDVIHTV